MKSRNATRDFKSPVPLCPPSPSEGRLCRKVSEKVFSWGWRGAGILLIPGCTTLPVTNAPQEAVKACQEVSESRDGTMAVITSGIAQGAFRGVLGWAVGQAVSGTEMSLKILSFKAVGTFTAGSLAGYLAALGLAEGVASGLQSEAKERERIVRECLRDIGFKAY